MPMPSTSRRPPVDASLNVELLQAFGKAEAVFRKQVAAYEGVALTVAKLEAECDRALADLEAAAHRLCPGNAAAANELYMELADMTSLDDSREHKRNVVEMIDGLLGIRHAVLRGAGLDPGGSPFDASASNETLTAAAASPYASCPDPHECVSTWALDDVKQHDWLVEQLKSGSMGGAANAIVLAHNNRLAGNMVTWVAHHGWADPDGVANLAEVIDEHVNVCPAAASGGAE